MSLSIRWLDHTAIAVRSIEEALPFYRDVLGGVPGKRHTRRGQGFQVVSIRFPHGGGIELIGPDGDTGFIQDFLAKHGEGVHHITFIVEDLRTAVEEARASGVRVVGEDYSRDHWKEAFISPRSANGTIIQLAQSTKEYFDPLTAAPGHIEDADEADED